MKHTLRKCLDSNQVRTSERLSYWATQLMMLTGAIKGAGASPVARFLLSAREQLAHGPENIEVVEVEAPVLPGCVRWCNSEVSHRIAWW